MPKPMPQDMEPDDHAEQSSMYLIALFFKEVPVKKEDFDQIRNQSWRQDVIDDMLALILASYIKENGAAEMPGFYAKTFRGLCNTVKYLYDFKHVRYDGEYYWYSPDKRILAKLKKEYRR
jgi:hypothetical protein